jgi:hypothetical protein
MHDASAWHVFHTDQGVYELLVVRLLARGSLVLAIVTRTSSDLFRIYAADVSVILAKESSTRRLSHLTSGLMHGWTCSISFSFEFSSDQCLIPSHLICGRVLWCLARSNKNRMIKTGGLGQRGRELLDDTVL